MNKIVLVKDVFLFVWRSPLQRGEFFFFEDLHHALLEGLAHKDLKQLQHSSELGQSEFNIGKVSQNVCDVPPHRPTSNTGSHSTSKSNNSPSSICVSMSIPI